MNVPSILRLLASPVVHVAQAQGFHVIRSHDLIDNGAAQDFDLFVVEAFVLVDHLAPEFLAAVDEVDLAAQARQVQRLFQGGIAAADDGHVTVAEEVPVAQGAIGHAPAQQTLFARHAQLAVAGPGGQHDGLGLDVLLPDLEGVWTGEPNSMLRTSSLTRSRG